MVSQPVARIISSRASLYASGRPSRCDVCDPRRAAARPRRARRRHDRHSDGAGEVTGVLPFSRMKQFTVERTRRSDSRVLRFPFFSLSRTCTENARTHAASGGPDVGSDRETTRFEQQRDRLASLGKLSAGLAHELNNPASAAKRATSQLRDILKQVRDASLELGPPRSDAGAKG